MQTFLSQPSLSLKNFMPPVFSRQPLSFPSLNICINTDLNIRLRYLVNLVSGIQPVLFLFLASKGRAEREDFLKTSLFSFPLSLSLFLFLPPTLHGWLCLYVNVRVMPKCVSHVGVFECECGCGCLFCKQFFLS